MGSTGLAYHLLLSPSEASVLYSFCLCIILFYKSMGIKLFPAPQSAPSLEFGSRNLIVLQGEVGVQKGGTSCHKTLLFSRTHRFTEGRGRLTCTQATLQQTHKQKQKTNKKTESMQPGDRFHTCNVNTFRVHGRISMSSKPT